MMVTGLSGIAVNEIRHWEVFAGYPIFRSWGSYRGFTTTVTGTGGATG